VFLMPAGVVPQPAGQIAAVPDAPDAGQAPQLAAASYAGQFLTELGRKQGLARVNGHGG
jgi:hypothetical protein